MTRSANAKHLERVWQQQSAQRERWSGNLSPEVPVVQPFVRGVSEPRRVAGTPASNRAATSPEGRELVANGTGGPITIILPFPPTLNHSSMPDGRGGRYLTDGHRSFRTDVAWQVAKQRLGRIDGRLAIRIDLYPSDNRRWDIDNRAKAVLDALQHAGVFKDDSAVDDLHITRQIAGNEAWAAVTVSVL